MMKYIRYMVIFSFTALLIGFWSCSSDDPMEISVDIQPVDINEEGFDLLENLEGHWVGSNWVIGFDYEWFCWDYRPISSSHILGLFEGGTMGNLFTSFYVTDFEDTRTIMARNGGLLSGLYRTSYFVLDSVSEAESESFYRLVDAVGGKEVMYMELRFNGDSLFFNSYTSRLGLNSAPKTHMIFKGKRYREELSNKAAKDFGFPKNEIEWDFSNGFIKDDLYKNDGDDVAKSATYMWESQTSGVERQANLSRDPFRIQDIENIACLNLKIKRKKEIRDKRLLVFLSVDPLVVESGTVSEEAFNSVVLFPELEASVNSFELTYLHPGDYFVTVVADMDGDGSVSSGDWANPSESIKLKKGENHKLTIDNIVHEN